MTRLVREKERERKGKQIGRVEAGALYALFGMVLDIWYKENEEYVLCNHPKRRI